MQIIPEQDDAHDFVALVEQSVNGILRQYAPLGLVLIKIDNWFGPKWLGFSGKALGAIGVWYKKLTIPPFVPNRIVSERQFVAPTYVETAMRQPIHLNIASRDALRRRVSEVARGAALVWFSGDSNKSDRGSVMAYVPVGGSYLPFYVGYIKRESWHVVKTIGINQQGLLELMEPSITSSTQAIRLTRMAAGEIKRHTSGAKAPLYWRS
jgi:hypothetical protein